MSCKASFHSSSEQSGKWGSEKDAEMVSNYFQIHKLVILGNEVSIKFSRYDHLVRPEEQSGFQCVLLVSIICRDNSTLSLRHFYSVWYDVVMMIVDL